MKIVQVHNYYQWAGGEDVVVATERALLQGAGHQVHLYAVNNSAITGVAAKVKAFRGAAYNRDAREAFWRFLGETSPDLVHVHNFYPLLSPSIYDACADRRVPVVQTLHNYRPFCAAATLFRSGKVCELCLHGHSYHAVLHRCYRGSLLGSIATAHMISYHRRRRTWLTAVARYIALTEFARDKFIEAGFPADRLVVKPNFTADPGLPDGTDRSGGLFVGRLSDEKGVPILLKAWAGIDQPLRILGDGPQRQALQAGAQPNVIFEGRVGKNQVRSAMRCARFIVLPSVWYEGMPMAVIEAFANGLPVVASRLGAFPELIEHGVTGRLFSPGDPDDLARVVRELLSDPSASRAMGAAARQRYEAKYTATQNREMLLALYSAVTNSPMHPKA